MAKILSGEVSLVCQLNALGDLECNANYDATTADNAIHGSLKLNLTATQNTQIKNFITGVVVPAIKSWESIN
jgi:hypothetical protein